jgi:MinD superfamily P-loop ATPase
LIEMPIIDQGKCNSCGLCVSVCACGAIVMEGDIITIIETADCHWCTNCEAVCPTDAVSCSFEIVIEEE